MINLEGVRRGDWHLERAKELDPTITSRPVPLSEILTETGMQKLTYSVTEAARLLGYVGETIRRAIRAGELKAAGGGKGEPYRISAIELERWWKARGGGDLFAPVTNSPEQTA